MGLPPYLPLHNDNLHSFYNTHLPNLLVEIRYLPDVQHLLQIVLHLALHILLNQPSPSDIAVSADIEPEYLLSTFVKEDL